MIEYPLNQIYFYLTEGCNLRCRHCWLAPKHAPVNTPQVVLSPDLFENILKQALPLGLTGVKFTGGEPLLHAGISDLLKMTIKYNLRMTMETNGTLLTARLAAEIASCKGAAASVSLDGSDSETHEWVRGVKGSFAAAVNGIGHLAAAGLKPQIIMTVMEHNRDQLEPIVRLAESLGAGSVKFNLLQPTARGESLHRTGEALDVKTLIRLGCQVENEMAYRTSLRLFYHWPAAFRPLSKLFGQNGDGCAACGIKNIIGVLADGSYALCGIGASVPDLVFGHGEKDRLERIWRHHPIIQEIHHGLPNNLQGICERCLMKPRCLGSCVAQNYYRAGSLWAAYWFCEETHRQGLFPESRLRPEIKANTACRDGEEIESLVHGITKENNRNPTTRSAQ